MSLVTAMIRPSGSSYRDNLCKHIFNKNPSDMIDNLLKNNLGYLVYQEDVIAFLQYICGLTGSEADNVRRAIGRKDNERLQKALPQILEGYCNKSDKDRDVAENEAKVFLKIIEDASSYMFGKNHSYAYCLLGYLCGYLRYYYPYEFLTAFFNCSETEEDIANGTELAKFLGIKIKEPLFRYSRADYFYDKETKTIYKGVSSIKYLNANVADQLYSLKNNTYNTFTDLLVDISKLSIDTRQMEVLIKLDFFKEFGTALQLTKIWNWFIKLKKLTAKNFKKSTFENAGIVIPIIERHCKVTTTQYTQLDCYKILLEIEESVKIMITEDFPFSAKISSQKEYLGYIAYKTERKEDRPKILVMSKKSFISKFGKDVGKPWAVSIEGYSLGSGKISNYTIYYNVYSKIPFVVDDVIYIDSWSKNNKGYYYIDAYHLNDKK